MLNLEVYGRGPDLVLLHGWGMHAGVMRTWAKDLARWFRVSLVDLPGHGRSGSVELTTLESWADAVLDTVPSGAWWLGWSLGGLVTLEAARCQPARIQGAVMIASTPKFVAAADWTTAIDATVFDQFADQLRENTERTLLRFASLQVRGSDHSAKILRQLRAELNARQGAVPAALQIGLRFLKETDLRGVLNELDLPVFWLLGERDTLVPRQLADMLGPERSFIVAGAGHAPFLSDPDGCTDRVIDWLRVRQEQSEYAAP